MTFPPQANAVEIPADNCRGHGVSGARDVILWTQRTFGQDWVLASSFGVEDIVLIDLIASLEIRPKVFFLDTGRIHEETYQTIDRVRQRYDCDLQMFAPDSAELARLISEDGYQGLYQSREQRLRCCQVRKLNPLAQALAGRRAWMTGLRSEQARSRADVKVVEIDPRQPPLYKINPLASWNTSQVWDYVRNHQVPYNSLHDRGFASIGCAPCTRAIAEGEHIRAGRWWWEDASLRECGLHNRGQGDQIEERRP